MEIKDLEIFKCKQDEILFVRYDSKLDSECTSDLLNDIYNFCQDNDVDCLMFPKSDEEVDIALSQMDSESLRRLEQKVHMHLQAKTKIVLA